MGKVNGIRILITVPLAHATNDTLRLSHAALAGLKRIYKPGYCYAKAGINLMDIAPMYNAALDLFADVEYIQQRTALMATLDVVNRRFGRNTLGPGVAGLEASRSWPMKRGNNSPSYTTDWGGFAGGAGVGEIASLWEVNESVRDWMI